MFNLFKKIPIQVIGREELFDKKITQTILAQKEAKKTLPVKTANELILEIHNAYDGSVVETLAWAEKIGNESNTDEVKKGERLAALGFTGTEKAVKSKDLIKKKSEAEQKAKLVNYYRELYPFQKFITMDQVAAINKKYGLVCVTADCYNKDIPEKNLAEIEAFKIKDKNDLVYSVTSLGKYFHTDNFVAKDDVKLLRDSRYGPTKVIEEPFYISCPFSEATIKQGYSYREETGFILQDEIKDPIVMKPVRGGFLIISKWGLEASDPIVVNQILN